MNKRFFYAILIILILGCIPNKEGEYIDYAYFQDPPMEFRSIPFYSLNDELDTIELKNQLAAFKEGGFGGSYLHSRTGLLTEYLGEEWWEAMDAGVNASDSLGIQAWFYDEDKWPSGFAGGIVPKMSEDYRGHSLVRMLKDDEMPSTGSLLFEDENYKYVDYQYKMGAPWFNGTCWVDLLNPDMVKAFIDVSYRPYAERYKEKYGTVTFGIFTDEPQIKPHGSSPDDYGVVSFSPTILDRFLKENEYDITPHVASLFDTVGEYQRIRIDYYRTLSNQFEESFSKQIGDYCEDHNIIWTGHYNGEESSLANARNVGNMAIQYRHMQQPGLDHLLLRIKGDIYGSKQVSSVANQYGKKRRLSEAFGVSGQNMSFEDRKWITDWHGIMGINLICPHLSLYSMKGERKRDYPPTLSQQQPWWKYNKIMEDYIGRICYINTIGQQQADFLILSPLESTYIEMKVVGKSYSFRDGRYNGFLKNLMDHHVDFDIGDEQILSDIAEVKDNKLVVGEMKYKALVLPYLLTIRSSTLNLIEEMEKMGLNIYFVNEYPIFIDGIPDQKEIEEILQDAIKINPDDVINSLHEDIDQTLSIDGDREHLIWKNRRLTTGGSIYQLSNTSRLETISCSINIKGENVVLWDPVSARCYSLENESELEFAPAQTWIISTGNASVDAVIKEKEGGENKSSKVITLPDKWFGTRKDVNALTLDYAKYSKSNVSTYGKPEPVIAIHSRLTKERYNGFLKLEFNVNVKNIPQSCSLVLEQPDMFQTILVNEKEISFTDNKSYRDHTFKMQNIDGKLKIGANTITLTLDYKAPILDSYDPYERYGSEIESIYLVGDFGVSYKSIELDEDFISEKNRRRVFKSQTIYRVNDFKIIKEKQEFKGTLINEGYPFYVGNFELTQHFNIKKKENDKKYYLSFDEIEATVLSASVNGKDFNPIAWSPWRIDITDAINAGENRITITLTNSLRNLLGPHHHIGGELISVGPGSFTGMTSWTSPLKGQDDWYDKRISGDATLWSDDYFLIPFGVKDVKVLIE